jgi:hypothetical protein
MTLEFEKLGTDLNRMAAAAVEIARDQKARAARLRELLAAHATDWPGIDAGLARAAAEQGDDPKFFRAARPLRQNEPLDLAVSPGPAPQRATIIATDGSQIMPDRHAAFLYSLINIGAFIYHHGTAVTPDARSEPVIFYPMPAGDDLSEEEPGFDKNEITLARDRREIEKLADLAWEFRHRAPLTLAVLDQRLLYWPFGGTNRDADTAVAAWTKAMTKVCDAEALLAGYIDRPGKRSVVTMLKTLSDDPDLDWKKLGQRPPFGELTDADLYAAILGPGERSPVFVDVSPANTRFADAESKNEVCFFYLNPGLTGPLTIDEQTIAPGRGLARVDIPMWVARDSGAVAAVHSLLVDQCRLIGGYPYALMRADELAVVGRDDETNLNVMIDQYMQRAGIQGSVTAKQSSKESARGGRTHHGFSRYG